MIDESQVLRESKIFELPIHLTQLHDESFAVFISSICCFYKFKSNTLPILTTSCKLESFFSYTVVSTVQFASYSYTCMCQTAQKNFHLSNIISKLRTPSSWLQIFEFRRLITGTMTVLGVSWLHRQFVTDVKSLSDGPYDLYSLTLSCNIVKFIMNYNTSLR